MTKIQKCIGIKHKSPFDFFSIGFQVTQHLLMSYCDFTGEGRPQMPPFEPTVVRGKWYILVVSNQYNSDTDAHESPLYLV
jgi:hypothetical protein